MEQASCGERQGCVGLCLCVCVCAYTVCLCIICRYFVRLLADAGVQRPVPLSDIALSYFEVNLLGV